MKHTAALGAADATVRVSARARALIATAAVLLALLAVIFTNRAQPQAPSVNVRGAHAQRGLQLLPIGALGTVSGVVGAEDPAYVARRVRAGEFAARSRGLRATFGRLGVSVTAGATRVQLRPLALSAGGARQELLAPVSPRAHANEVSYAYPSLRAWYRNGPAGIEQGFALTRAPLDMNRHSGSAALNLSFTVSSDARYAAAHDAQSVTFARHGAPTLRLLALSVTDATGRRLPSGFAVTPGGLQLHIDAARARYPITIDPLLQEGTRLTGPGEVGPGEFGLSVAVSADGTTALVGATRDNTFSGAVWVFVRSGSTWTQQGPKLVAGGSAEAAGCSEEPIISAGEEGECGFGASLALSADGNTAIIGSPRDNGFKGGAWVFTRTGATWSRAPEELSGAGEVGEGHFGKEVALSADGTVALVSAPADSKGRGAVWAFTRAGIGWVPLGEREGKITPSDETGAGYFGRGLALSADGSRAIIGGPGDTGYRGAVWMFARSLSGWAEQTKVTGAEESGAGRFGYAVAASEEAGTVLVGAPRDNADAGAVWVFTRSGGTLTQEGAKLTGPGEVGEGIFGRSLAIAASGSTALIAAPRDRFGHGAAWAFTHSPAGWTGQKFSAPDGSRGRFGASIALSSDGNIPMFGEPLAERKVGVAWAGLPPADVAAVEPSSGPANGGTNVTITGAGFTEVTGVYFGTRPAVYAVTSSSSIVALSPSGAGGSTVDVTVVTAHGASETSPADRFTYIAPEGGGGSGSGSGAGSDGGEDGETASPESEAELGLLGSSASSSSRCRFALLSAKVAVLSHGRAAPRLRRLGSGRCAGRLSFTVRLKGKNGHTRSRSIGSTRFAISGSTPVTVRVSLNSFGLSLLRGGHGQMRASLVVSPLVPPVARSQTASVTLRLGH